MYDRIFYAIFYADGLAPGMFSTESAAEKFLAELGDEYPNSRIARISITELPDDMDEANRKTLEEIAAIDEPPGCLEANEADRNYIYLDHAPLD